MTNDSANRQHAWPAVYQGELLPEPDPDATAPTAATLDELLKSLRRQGIPISAPDREIHDWDGTCVTSYVRCTVGEHPVWGAGIARDRTQAMLRAVDAAAHRVAVAL